MNSADSGTACDPNSLTNLTRRGRALQLRQVGQDAAVSHHGSGDVGFLEGALQPAVQHALVPRGKLMTRDERDRQLLDVEGVAVTHGQCERLVVPAPGDDRRVMSQDVHGLGGLAHRFTADLSGVGPLQREVLPDQHAEFVGRRVQLGTRDVPVDPQQIQTRVTGQFHVTTQIVGGGVGQHGARRGQIGALDEQALTVDRVHPVAHGDLA